MRGVILALSLSTLGWAQTGGISGERIRAHVKFLSSDLLEGRGVAVRGGDLATEYIASQFAVAGASTGSLLPTMRWFADVSPS